MTCAEKIAKFKEENVFSIASYLKNFERTVM